MDGKKRVRYQYKDIGAYEDYDHQVRAIIKEASGLDQWIATRSLPPIGFPLCARPLPTEFIEKLKNLGDGIVIDEIVEDE